VIGLPALDRSDGVARLGAEPGRPLVELHERPGARPVPRRGRLGLYHFAILLPDRASLGRFVAHLAEAGARAGAADHLVSEALYLHDPDGNGLELYFDRPRPQWPKAADGSLRMTTEPLDGQSAFAGRLRGVENGYVVLEEGRRTHRVPLDRVKRAQLAVEF